MNTNEDLQEIFDALMDKEVNKMIEDKGVMTLGEIKAWLTGQDIGDLPVKFEDGTYPGEFHSYRGYYQFIAIDKSSEECLVHQFYTKIVIAIGSTFEGYKGGEYKMSKMTPVWVASWGYSSGRGITDIRLLNDRVQLVVSQIED